MRNIEKLAAVGVVLLTSFFPARGDAGERRVEAEEMELTHYQIERGQSEAFIKLTAPTGVAKFRFDYPSGRYDVDARYLSEKAGQNTFAVYLNDHQIISWLGKNRDDRWHRLSEQQWHVPRNIAINRGDMVRIESLSGQGSLAILDYLEFSRSSRSDSTTEQDLITIFPEEYSGAIRNPLKGFRPRLPNAPGETDAGASSRPAGGHEYGTLSKMYLRWNELETKASDGVDKIRAVSDARWRGVEQVNHKIIPRVYLLWPRRQSGWPADMTDGDFTSAQFEQRVVAMIRKLGEAWDNDSRVAYVEMGLIGEWGEMEWPDTRDDLKGRIAAEFAAAFQNKRVMIRWPNTYNDQIYNFGYYWDSLAHKDQEYFLYHLAKTEPRWKTAPIGGEVAYDWGNSSIQPGGSPDESLKNSIHRDYILDCVRKAHANHVGWIAHYSHDDEEVRAGAALVQKALGYRFVISEVTYPRRIEQGVRFTLSFKVRNTGSSPFYYDWPLEVSLLDPQTKEVVWRQTCKDVDIRKWMPGDAWDDVSDRYEIPAEENLVNQTLEVSGLPAGEYILALAVLDPAGGRPSARFAIKNYFTGGRHPMGKVGVNQTIATFKLSDFDDIQSDKSLSYDKPGK